MEIAQTEVFAPVFVLMRAYSVADAISLANSTQYALGASVFGHRQHEVQACVAGIKAGMVAVNDFGTTMPFSSLLEVSRAQDMVDSLERRGFVP
jgi:acyl-CoA reductase-like NAD-dependent aldehyde dehydrogenase